MKKTLIALAVVASTAVSGSAIADSWITGGTGGTVEMGGTVTIVADSNSPWAVKTGAVVNNLDANIVAGGTVATVALGTDISILSIRSDQVFKGRVGIAPQIDYSGAVDINSFSKGYAPLTLEVKNSKDEKIGTAKTSIFAVALVSNVYSSGGTGYRNSMYAPSAGYSFWGGVAKSKDLIAPYNRESFSFVTEAAANYTEQGVSATPGTGAGFFSNQSTRYSGFYASGIEKSKTIVITLDEPATSSAISWKASLPVTVSYA
ncbi:TPA: fimbrial protein [Escherichia coli]|uniref:F4 family fimbrial subunit n=1 Tax=Enterobacteriaceae TaxID=543 RepID=UPI0019A2FA5A|nr:MULTISPECIES: fimbrial protein [Enterobacteriaceae]EID2656006.1 fimbrial protein [Escherichia coli]EIL6850260.1 fimbrial protein [Escherichia coli]EJD5910132.1 fimbrial protein [Escherichia coli]EKR6313922.1 fimbrial protein [Escherichia coli]MBX8975658.1 fimbrial protein [Escherichia coli]